jgi:hypothetical protein
VSAAARQKVSISIHDDRITAVEALSRYRPTLLRSRMLCGMSFS